MSRINKLENIYQKQLKEKDIQDVSKFIQTILNVDITKGKYARFLIESFLNDKFLEEDLVGGFDSTVGQAVSLFDKHKGKLPINERSVYALDSETGKALYQSPGDLWNNVKQFQGELSGKELKKEEQEQIYRKTEFVYKDEETGFQIISPLTKESAKWWGKGTRWCTSADNNNMFEHYAKKSPLFILLMPDGNKLQLWKNGNDIQFMDEADNDVTLDYIKQNWSKLELICKWLNDLSYVPDKYRTKELCDLAVKQNGMALNYVPEELRTKDIYKLAVQQNGLALQYVPEELRTKELYELAVQNNGYALQYVPDKHKTKELCNIAIQNKGMALQYIPKELRIKELCLLAIQQNSLALNYVPEELRTKELYELAVKQNGYALVFIPDKYRTYKICELTVQQNSLALKFIPEKHKTKGLCEIAVKQNGLTLPYVPKELRTKELCLLAVKNNGEALQYVPKKYITKELCDIAVKQNGLALQYVPDKYLTEFQQFLPEINLPKEIYQKKFQEIKILFPIKDISLSYDFSRS